MTEPDSITPEAQAPSGLPIGRAFEAHGLSAGKRLAIMAFNLFPLLQVAGLAVLIAVPWAASGWRLAAAAGALYLLPAILARFIVTVFPFHSTSIVPGSSDFFKWWALLNLQVLFCRFPALEEALRIVPSLYSAWLRLWGSRIGRLVYWSAGTRILDRSFLEIGDDVVFGAGVRLNPHVLARNERGEQELRLAPIRIGARCMIGGYALLTAGTEIAADEATQACLLSPPFSKWKDGKRVKA